MEYMYKKSIVDKATKQKLTGGMARVKKKNAL
jgi:hypothetical protein